MAHTLQPYTLLSDLALVHNGSSTPPVAQTSNATTLVPKTPSRRPRTPFIIFRDVFLAANKNMLPKRQIEVNAIAGPVWHGLSEEQQLVYKTLARLEREVYERDNPAHALQHRGSSGGKGSKDDQGCTRIPSQSAADLPHGPGIQGTEAQNFPYHAPTTAPAVAPRVPHVQNPTLFMMNTDEMLYDVHATQGQSMVDTQHGYAARNMQFSYQWPASTSVATTFAEQSDPQIHNHATYYHNASGQNFAIMNPTAILQYLPSVPAVAPTAHGLNPLPVAFYRHELDANADVRNDASHSSAASSMEVGSSTGKREFLPYYERPAPNTWDDLQYHQRQL
ncbi:hypothetical protein EDD85DRAFT_954470 [Armillaria nabsnona]|nr:hypothetical protein EDD85DRAFT_954470 [Armillaria nabsnona]